MTITPEIIADHGLTPEEYDRIETHMGRAPNLLELGIFSVMWSEHCSYKSSRRHLAKLPTMGPQVICGPGENAGVIDIGDGQAAIFKMESHNHPSFIEPYQGAATGVGGIMRDVFTMGARPIANMNALRFGAIDHEKTAHLISGVVAGIGGYGNCMGVPTVGGETNFDAGYNGNILVNAMCVGLADKDKIFYSAAKGTGNPVVYVGAKTGRDGIHGATMASAEFDEASDEKRPTVQVGDPFTEKLLLEACLELMAEDAIIAIQDMGAAGLTSSSVEMAAKGGGGFDMDLDKVPQREEGMSAYEMMLSESQERMLMVIKPEAEEKSRAIFEKWGLDFSIIGTTTDTGRLVIRHLGEVQADLPVPPLAEDAPNYDRPHSARANPEPLADPIVTFSELQTRINAAEQQEAALRTILQTVVDDYVQELPGLYGAGWSLADGTAILHVTLQADAASLQTVTAAIDNLKATHIIDAAAHEITTQEINLAEQAGPDTPLTALAALLGEPDLCSREWIWSQYDHTVMGDTIVAPGGNAAVVRVHDSQKALAISTDVTPRYCQADPFEGGKQAVAETYRNISATGAEPLAITNCLNFGNPERPDIMAQFVGCIEGMAEACEALSYPVVSGNVSLYNETNGAAIPPTPAIGGVGLIDHIQHTTRSDSAQEGDALVALGITRGWLGQSLYLRDLFGLEAGAPPPVDLKAECETGDFIRKMIRDMSLSAVTDVADGGLLVAAAEMAMSTGIGLALTTPVKTRQAAFWFGEDQGRYLVALPTAEADTLILKASMAGIQATRLGIFGRRDIYLDGDDTMELQSLVDIHKNALPDYIEQPTGDAPMPMARDDIQKMILDALPDAEVEIEDLAGDGDHYKARITSEAFNGKSRVAQHQLVYKALKGKMGGELHALALETVAKN
ncbi:MAG: phosphoribosylformylglycinamidine synthase subunit PurL [bacterium]